MLTTVYRAAFTAPGYDEPEEAVARFRREQLPTHAARAGFRCTTLHLAGTVAGFAYGYTGERGQWWTDTVAARVPAVLADEWLGGHFELVEVAVAPEHQGRGFGAALVDGLLLGLPHDRALLTTYDDERPAPRLYRRLGWELLATGALDGERPVGPAPTSDVLSDVCRCGARRQGGESPLPPPNGAPMNTRTIAILALVIVVVLVIFLFLR